MVCQSDKGGACHAIMAWHTFIAYWFRIWRHFLRKWDKTVRWVYKVGMQVYMWRHTCEDHVNERCHKSWDKRMCFICFLFEFWRWAGDRMSWAQMFRRECVTQTCCKKKGMVLFGTKANDMFDSCVKKCTWQMKWGNWISVLRFTTLMSCELSYTYIIYHVYNIYIYIHMCVFSSYILSWFCCFRSDYRTGRRNSWFSSKEPKIPGLELHVLSKMPSYRIGSSSMPTSWMKCIVCKYLKLLNQIPRFLWDPS